MKAKGMDKVLYIKIDGKIVYNSSAIHKVKVKS